MSLAQRAIVALALMVSFYLLALGIAGGLLWAAYATLPTSSEGLVAIGRQLFGNTTRRGHRSKSPAAPQL